MDYYFVMKNKYKVLLPFCSIGGFGDIAAAKAISEYLSESGLKFYTYADGGSEGCAARTASKMNIDIGRKIKNQKSDRLISICPVRDGRDELHKGATKYTIRVGEYDKPPYGARYPDLKINTGFGWNSRLREVQAGIYPRKCLEFMFSTADKALTSSGELNSEYKRDLLIGISRDYGPISDLVPIQDSEKYDFSLVYPSTVGTLDYFYGILNSGKNKLSKPLIVFQIKPYSSGQRLLWDFAKKFKFSYAVVNGDGIDTSMLEKDSPINIFHFDSVNEMTFFRMTTLANKLSLVTGDHSLSNMVLKSCHRYRAPFLYQRASWKKKLEISFTNLLKKSSSRAAELFEKYPELHQGLGMVEGEVAACRDLSSLLYEDDLIEDYLEATKKIKTNFIQTRREAGVKNAELLWSVPDTIGHVLQGLMAGKGKKGATKDLLPKGWIHF